MCVEVINDQNHSPFTQQPLTYQSELFSLYKTTNMKPIHVLSIAVLFLTFSSFIPGDNCESYFASEVGTTWEQTSYDAKNKVTGRTTGKVKAYDAITGGFAATMEMAMFDDKNKPVTKGDVIMKCQDDKFYMDMSNMFPKDMAEIEGAEIEIDNEFSTFPNNPVPGQTLPDETSTMTVKLNGMAIMTMTIKTTNRKIEGFESVTTPAGTYNCVKYTSDSEVKSMFTMKSRTVMYMSKHVGAVKVENYDDKGKLQGTQVLTKFDD